MKKLNTLKHFAIVASLMATTVFFNSCKDKETEQVETVLPEANSIEQNKAALQNATPNAAGQAVAEGMNPPHGQPLHRCDIAVGAPLNSASGNTKTSPSINTTTKPVQMETTTNSGALNPAHGKPGHRCDLTVGAPLPKQ